MKPAWTPSVYQEAIFNDIATNIGHLFVEALAGSAKTSTAIEGLRHVPRGKTILMVAFNKVIAEELRSRAPSYCNVSTLHSLGFKAIREAKIKVDGKMQFQFPDVKFDKHKMNGIFNELLDEPSWDQLMSLRQCTSLCKGFLFDTPAKVAGVIDEFRIETGDLDEETFIKMVLQGLRFSKEQKATIDFDDMVWFCFVYALNPGKFDFVFLDEAQDLSACSTALAISACKPDGRIIGLGDRNQAIYRFAGADADSVDNIITKLGAHTLTLPITYRCPKKVVALAQEFVPALQHAPDASDGIVEYLAEEDLLTSVEPGDVVISRLNAPLIKYCLALLKKGRPANILGRDVGDSLGYFVRKSKKKTMASFLTYLTKWETEELKRVAVEKRNPDPILDKAECLRNLCEGCSTIKELTDNIKSLFEDVPDDKKVLFSSTHKYKGKENNRVFLLQWTYRYRSKDHQEVNLWYVGITRSKRELYIVRK